MRAPQQLVHSRMNAAGGSKDHLGFSWAVRLPNLLNVQRGKHHAFGIAKSHGPAWTHRAGKLLHHIKRYGNRPERAVSKAHFAASLFVVSTRHETAQG